MAGLFCFQLGGKCLRDDLSIAHHEGIGGKRSIIKGRVARPEDVCYFAFDDLLRQIKRGLVGWKHGRKILCEKRPNRCPAFQGPVWSEEPRLVSISAIIAST